MSPCLQSCSCQSSGSGCKCVPELSFCLTSSGLGHGGRGGGGALERAKFPEGGGVWREEGAVCRVCFQGCDSLGPLPNRFSSSKPVS